MSYHVSSERRRSQSGQTLILAMLAIIIIAAAIVFLFDLQNIIRGKIKAQSAADAAALVGAKWQVNSLNVIGELNIIKACTAIITDMPKTASGTYSDDPLWAPHCVLHDDDRRCLKEAAELISQMQIRTSIVGPLIGFGAAQQAAKNNGLNYVEAYNEDLSMRYNYLATEEGDLYYGSDVTNPMLYGYAWREPYAEMIKNILQSSGSSGKGTGVAVFMNSDWVSDPDLESDSDIFNNYLTIKSIYYAINANYWCALIGLLREDFSESKWWGDIELIIETSSFRYESELLPLEVRHNFSGSAIYNQAFNSGALEGEDVTDDRIMDNYNAPDDYDRPSDSKLLHRHYDNEDPYLCDENGEFIYTVDGAHIVYDAERYDIDTTGGTGINKLYYIDPATGDRVYPGLYTKDSDEYWAPLPRITWTVYSPGYWYSYDDKDSDTWTTTWGKFLKSDFKDGYRYYGAVSCAGTLIEPTLISSRWNRLKSDTEDEDHEYIGDALEVGGGSSAGGRELNTYARRIKRAETSMRDNSISDIEVISLAKPYGRIPVADGNYLTPCNISMVLPVFEKPQLIPVELERPSDYTPDYKWSAFKQEYLPLLGTVRDINAMPALMADLYPEHWNAGWFSKYHAALLKLNDASWRQQGIDWLKTVINEETGRTNEDTCDYWPDGGPGTRHSPSIPF